MVIKGKINRKVVFWALLTSASLFLFSCFWRGWDWYISESHAAIIASALGSFHEVPYFSFFWNQGSYLMQDPQSPFFSLLTPLLYFFPSGLALRLVILLVCLAGFLGCFYWLKRYFSEQASLVGASCWCLNLWTLTRIAAGNDLFIYGLLLPWILIAIENLLQERKWVHSLHLSFVMSFLILAPSIHALVYLMIPVAASWFLIQLFCMKRLSRREGFKIVTLSFVSLLITAALCLPKLVAIARLPGVRAIPPDFDLKFLGLIFGAFLPIYAGQRPLSFWGEYGADTSQVSMLLAMQGMVFLSILSFSRFKKVFLQKDSRLRWLVWTCFGLAILLIYSRPLIAHLNSHSTVSLRVLWRFAMIFSIPFTVMSAVAWENLQLKKPVSLLLILNIISVWIAFVPYYTKSVRRDSSQYLNPLVTRDIFRISGQNVSFMKGIRSSNVFSDLTSQWTAYNVESIEAGYGLIGLPHSSGNSCYKEVMYGHACLAYADRLYKKVGAPGSQVSVCSGDCESIQISHHSIRITSEKKEGSVDLLLKIPDLGFLIPPEAGDVQITPLGPDMFRLSWEALSSELSGVELQVRPLVQPREWIIWFALVSIIFTLYLACIARRLIEFSFKSCK